MKYDFALLRFAEDKNIADRLYWYLTDFPVSVGEEVLAPIGMHDRLQCARVERTLAAEGKDAPYDVRLIKRLAARRGARKLVLGGAEFLEFGGLRYDEKHYTRFGRVLFSRELPADRTELNGYGITKIVENGDLGELARANGGVLLIGEEGERAFAALISFCRGKTELGGETAALLREKLL